MDSIIARGRKKEEGEVPKSIRMSNVMTKAT